jgi:CHRD domain
MRWYNSTVVFLAFATAVLPAGYARAQNFSASLNGFEELGPLPGPSAAETGAIFTAATGTLRLTLGSNSIGYELSYTSGFTSGITQAHIHFGKEHVPGGIIAFLCTNLGNGPAGTPACPDPNPSATATVTGTLTAASVVGPAGQNISPGNFEGLVAALLSNTAYGNIHTSKFPAGEIRGQIVLVFAGTPGNANCSGQSVSALSRQFGGLDAAAAALSFPSTGALQNAVLAFCGG